MTIEIRSNKGGVVHTVETWEEIPTVAEKIESLRPKYFTDESFPMLASCEGLSFAIVIGDKEKKEVSDGDENPNRTGYGA